jgi:hypothetical protein
LDQLTVSVFYEEEPVRNANVVVCQISDANPLDKIYFPLVMVKDSHYTFDTKNAKDGALLVTVTAHNFVPYTGTVQKVSAPISPWKYQTRGGFCYNIVPQPDSAIYAGAGNDLYSLSAMRPFPPQWGWIKVLNGKAQCLASAPNGDVLVGLAANVPSNLILMNSKGLLNSSG